MHFPLHISLRLLSGVCTALLTSAAFAASSGASFSDIPKNHFAYDAIIYLSDRNILAGYSDGTYKPDRKVNRAEALKIIASAFIPKTQNVQVKSTSFTDIPDNVWYLPAIMWGLEKHVIDGPPTNKTFNPTRAVTKSEFLKMLLIGNGINLKDFNDITLPLSSDVTDTSVWFYPSMRYAVATATTTLTDSGLYGPNRELTRGDVALILYRFTLYRSNQRTQDLLSETRKNVETVIVRLSQGDVREAEFASARAILLARGALVTEPDEAVVKVAVKIAEGYRALTRAYRAGVNGDASVVMKLAADATTLAGQARKISPEAKTLADQLEKYSKSFAEQAGKKK